MRKLLIALLLTGAATVAHAQELIYCVASNLTICNSVYNPGRGWQGDPLWKISGKANDNFKQLYGMFGVTGVLYGNGAVPNALTAATGAQILTALGASIVPIANGGTGTSSPGLVAGTNVTITGSWPDQTINSTASGMVYPGSGIPNSTGSAWGTSYGVSGTGNVALTTNPVFTTPNLGTPSALTLTNASGLPCAATPALTGDVTTSAGSCATTVSKVSGATGGIVNNTNGAASSSAETYGGTVYTGGTGTTTYPYIFVNQGATGVTTWSTNGTEFGINAASGFTGNFLDVHVNGGSSLFSINYQGNATGGAYNGSIIPTSAGTLTGSTGAFTLNDCVKVGATSPLEVADAGACSSSSSSSWSTLTSITGTQALGSLTASQTTLGLSETYNNSGVTFSPITWTLTNTASHSGSGFYSFLAGSGGNVCAPCVDANGNATFGGTITSTAPGPHLFDVGTAGAFARDIPNDASTATVLNQGACLIDVANARQVENCPTTANVSNFEGIVFGGAGTSGNAQVAYLGPQNALFAATSVTDGDYFGLSGSTAGQFVDLGSSTLPNCGTTQALGKITQTATGTSPMTVTVDLEPNLGCTASSTHVSVVSFETNHSVTASTTDYDVPSQSSTTAPNIGALLPFNGTIKNLTIYTTGAQGSGQTTAFTIMTGSPGSQTASAVTCSENTTSQQTCSYTGSGVSVTAGQAWSLKIVSGTTAPLFVMVGFEYDH